MAAASRPSAIACAVLAAASVVAVTPLAARPFQLPTLSVETRLVDAEDSILNVPINLFHDLVDIPFNEIQGLDVYSDSLLFSGDWWVPSATNLWGTDPGDIGHYMGLADLLIPFATISGLDQPEIDPTALANGTAGLAQQIAMLAAAELPVSASCDAETCAPVLPTTQITGITDIDRILEFFNTITLGKSQFPLVDDWLKVPLSDLLKGFTFTTGDDPGLVDPSPDTGTGGAVSSTLGFDGTTDPTDPTATTTGDAGLMPWAGDTFKLNLLGPLEDFYQSLLASPETAITSATVTSSGVVPDTGIQIPTFQDVIQAFQNLAASFVVAFDPDVEGSSVCPAACDMPTYLTMPALLQDILRLDPSNTTLQTYVAGLTTGLDSAATTTEAETSIALLQTGIFNLNATQLANVDADLAKINPELPALFTNAGILTDPGYLAFTTAAENGTTIPWDPVYGGYDPDLILSDLWNMLVGNSTGTDPAWVTDAGAALGLLDPMNLVDFGSMLLQSL
jgi:hypothetical protein